MFVWIIKKIENRTYYPIQDVLRLCEKINEKEVSILDLGFGQGSHWKSPGQIKINSNIALTTIDIISNKEKDLDKKLNKFGVIRKNAIEGYIPTVLYGIKDNSFDLVIAYDLIEHLPKHEAVMLIYQMKRIASKFTVVFTPNGFQPQPPDIDNIHNAHLSGFKPKFFKTFGFKEIYGAIGIKNFYGEYSISKIKFKNSFFEVLFSYINNLVVRKVPNLGYSIVAIHAKKM